MRVCHITSGDQWAGAEVMCYRLLRGLQEYKNIEQSAILFNEGKLAEEIRMLGIPLWVIDETRMNFIRMVRNFQTIIKDIKPDILHSHRIKENIFAYLSVKSTNKDISLIATLHGMPEPILFKYKIMKHFLLSKFNYFILSRYFKFVIAVSDDMQKLLIKKYGFSEEKIKLIYNGTEIPPDHSRAKKDTFVIGTAGRLFPIKNYTLLVDIANEIAKITDDIRFELAGEGPEKEHILGLIQKFNIGEVFTLKGFVDDIKTFYMGLDLYINTSWHEGLPMSILEAMAHGLPVVASNTGGLKEIVNDGVQGYLIDGHNPKLFSETCLKLYRNPELRLKMSTASRDLVVEKFNIRMMAKKYHDIYQNSSKLD